jgi:nucleotide-binding universal stress UspA family protein
MFKTVLVGVDGRPSGRDAIALASRLTDPDGKLILAHVHRGEVAEEREGARKLLEQERAGADVKARLLSVVSTSPGRGLHEQAETQDADLLVVGSCSHGAFGRAMLGDDTRAALNGAPCAVAVAPRGYAERAGGAGSQIAKIGVGYDASPESITALAVAGKLAAMTGASTHAVQVVSIPSTAYAGIVASDFGDYIDAILREANSRLQELPDVQGHAVYGLAGEELAAFGDQVDILVVGSRGYGPVKRLVLGSTSAYLQRHARCPLLVLPRTAASPADDSTASGEPQAETTAGTAA